MKKAITQVQIIILFVIVLAILFLFIGNLGAKTQKVLEKLGLQCAGMPGMCPKDCFKEVNKDQFLKYVGYAAENAWVEKKSCYFETTIKGETPTKYEVYNVLRKTISQVGIDDDCLYPADIYSSNDNQNSVRIQADFTKENAMVFWTTPQDECAKGILPDQSEVEHAGGAIILLSSIAGFGVSPYLGIAMAGAGVTMMLSESNTLVIFPREDYCLRPLPFSNLYTYSMHKVSNSKICNNDQTNDDKTGNKIELKAPTEDKNHILPITEFADVFSKCTQYYDKEDVKASFAIACGKGENTPPEIFNLQIGKDITLEELIKNFKMGASSVELASYDRSFNYPMPSQPFRDNPLSSNLNRVVYVKLNGFPIDKDKDNKDNNLILKKGIHKVGLFYYEDASTPLNDMIMEINSLKCGLSQECQFNNVCKRTGCAIPDPDCVTFESSKAFKLSEYCKNKRVGDECDYLDENGKPTGVKGECLFYDDLFATKVLLDKSKVFSPLFCLNRNDGKCEDNPIVTDIDCLEQVCEDKKEGDTCEFMLGGKSSENTKCSF